ncbi:MAG TPA: cytochrome b6-f complex subunit PetL [Cyanothece sp. UBA12306]|nr:cytochrome b6-f complex subunit PetL [Cyanothece sp. UBA12306]
MSAFTVFAFAGYLIVFTGITLGLYFGLRNAKII